jgi:hypothetical protein
LVFGAAQRYAEPNVTEVKPSQVKTINCGDLGLTGTSVFGPSDATQGTGSNDKENS